MHFGEIGSNQVFTASSPYFPTYSSSYQALFCIAVILLNGRYKNTGFPECWTAQRMKKLYLRDFLIKKKTYSSYRKNSLTPIDNSVGIF
jgi:hypothetical protein